MGGAHHTTEVIYEDLEDDDLFRHIAWELPKRNKVIPDEEFKSHRNDEELYRSSVLLRTATKFKKNQLKFSQNSSQSQSSYKLGFNTIEPQRIILDEEELDNEHESQRSQKNLVNKSSYLNQAASTFKMSEKMEPKHFEEDDILENSNSFSDNPYQKPESKASISNNYKKNDHSKASISNTDNNKKNIPLIGFSENSIQDKLLKEKEMSHEQIHSPVSNDHPSKKNINVFRPPPKDDDDDDDDNMVINQEKQEMILPKTPVNNANDIPEKSNGGSRRSSKDKKPEDLIKLISSQQPSEKNSHKGSMQHSLAPILEHPDEHKYKYDPKNKVQIFKFF